MVSRIKSNIVWKYDGYSGYSLLYANFDTHIKIVRGSAILSTYQFEGRTMFRDSGLSKNKWYISEGWYTYRDMPFDTLKSAKEYATSRFVSGAIKGMSWTVLKK